MNFLIDMPLSPALAAWLRGRGHNAVHAVQIGLDRASDVEIVERAKQEDRTIVTVDLDYPRLLALARSKDPSLILFRDGRWSDTEIIGRMDDIRQILSPAEIGQSVIVVDRERVRRRRLPIER